MLIYGKYEVPLTIDTESRSHMCIVTVSRMPTTKYSVSYLYKGYPIYIFLLQYIIQHLASRLAYYIIQKHNYIQWQIRSNCKK